jgi:hypothetical protein
MKMGLQYGLEGYNFCKRAFRWLLKVPGVAADNDPGVDALPPEKGSRPVLSYKEIEVRHINEDIYYPGKPDWKPINLVLFDLLKPYHPVFNWLKKVYDPQSGRYRPVLSSSVTSTGAAAPMKDRFIKECFLTMYDGCGNVSETWLFEDVWPQTNNFQQLDMGQSAIMTCDITLRYARAYVF